MLASLGLGSLEELTAETIPAAIHSGREPLPLGPGIGESALLEEARALAKEIADGLISLGGPAEGFETCLVSTNGTVLDSIDADFGAHTVGTDSLIFIPIYSLPLVGLGGLLGLGVDGAQRRRLRFA